MYKTIILTGIPRSGSTLSCKILNDYENTLALLEPMNPSSISAKEGKYKASLKVSEFAFESRKKVLETGLALSRHKEGVISSNFISESSKKELRESIVKLGDIEVNKKLDNNFTLIIKQNAFFTSILDELIIFFPCYGIVRNPLSILASWSTVDLPINKGHIPAGERFDETLFKTLNITEDVLDRQIIILNWFFERFDKYLPKKNIIKYENIIKSNGNNFFDLSFNKKLEKKLDILENKNSSHLYQNVDIDKFYKKLLNSTGVFWKYYSYDDITSVYYEMKENHQAL